MAEIVDTSGFDAVPEGHTSAAVAFGSQWLFFNQNGRLAYWKWKKGSQSKVKPQEVVVSVGAQEINWNVAMKAATTEDGKLRVYLTSNDEIVELKLDEVDGDWANGDLTARRYKVARNTNLAVIPTPIQVIFKDPSLTNALAIAYVGEGGWRKDPLENLIW